MWLCGSLVTTILLTVGPDIGQACQANEQISPLLDAMNDLSSAFAGMSEAMSAMSSAINNLSSAFAQVNRPSGMSDSAGESNTGVECAGTDAVSDQWSELVQNITLLNQPENDYRITRVSKRDMGDHYQLTMDYAPNDTRPELFAQALISNVVYGGDMEPREDGKVIMDLSKDNNIGYGTVTIYIKFPSGVRLYVDVGFGDDTMDEMDIPRVLVSVSPQNGDIAFEPGTQPRLELTLWTQKLDGVAVADIEVDYKFLVRTDEDSMTVFSSVAYNPNVNYPMDLQVLDAVERPGYHHWKYAINSSFHDPEGYLRVIPKLRFNCSSSKCLVRNIDIRLPKMSLRRTDHATPFPENFFGFMFYGAYLDMSFLSGVQHCFEEPACPLTCMVSWADQNKTGSPISVEMNEVTPDGDVVALGGASELVARHAKTWFMQSLENVTLADSGRVFRCTARSGQREISKDFELLVLQPARFIRDLTNVTRFNNGSVAATCVAEGSPRPSVIMDVFRDRNPGPSDNVTVTELNEITTKASVVVTDNSTSFWCTARQNAVNANIPFDSPSIDPGEL